MGLTGGSLGSYVGHTPSTRSTTKLVEVSWTAQKTFWHGQPSSNTWGSKPRAGRRPPQDVKGEEAQHVVLGAPNAGALQSLFLSGGVQPR